ncbi:hypothetical protein HispidOSU_026233, partial [Sigmodon hispidus]
VKPQSVEILLLMVTCLDTKLFGGTGQMIGVGLKVGMLCSVSKTEVYTTAWNLRKLEKMEIRGLKLKSRG